MEAWLGMRDDDNNDTLTVEDCLPISDDVYRQAVAVFGSFEYRRDECGILTLATLGTARKSVITCGIPSHVISIHHIWPSVRVAHWMTQWLE